VGWVVAVVLAPIVFALVAVYVVLKLALVLLRLVFAPVALLRLVMKPFARIVTICGTMPLALDLRGCGGAISGSGTGSNARRRRSLLSLPTGNEKEMDMQRLWTGPSRLRFFLLVTAVSVITVAASSPNSSAVRGSHVSGDTSTSPDAAASGTASQADCSKAVLVSTPTGDGGVQISPGLQQDVRSTQRRTI
jgi:hypothetical protein